MTYIIYYFLKKTENIKIDRIVKNARYVEGYLQKKIDEVLDKNERTSKYVFNIEKRLRESKLGTIGLTNVYIFFILTLVLGYSTFSIYRKLLNQQPAAFILAAFTTYLPYELLKLEVSLKRGAVRKHLPHFFLTVLQLLEATDDIIDALDNAVLKIKKPLKDDFGEFVRNYKSGKELNICIDTLKSRFDNPILLKFADDIESNIKNGTKIRGVLDDYVIKAYNNQINFAERITENTGNITGALIIAGIFLNIVYNLNKMQPELMSVLKNNLYGQVAVDIVILLAIAALFMMKHSIAYEDSK